MIFFLFLLIGTLVLLAILNKSKKESRPTESELEQRNLEWAQFIASYRKRAKTTQEKELIKNMLLDIKNSGLPVDNQDLVDVTNMLGSDITVSLENHTPKIIGDRQSQVIEGSELDLEAEKINSILDEGDSSNGSGLVEDKKDPIQPIDGPTMLLYFGAFLFIAAAGLFVGMSGVPGTLKTIIVLLVVVSLYALGLWLYNLQTKFSQVGVTFAGIGLAIAPLVGMAAYSFALDYSNGRLVWFITSVFCLALYWHAMVTLKKPLLNYIFIFTLLSLFESSVSIISAPIYVFGWMMAVLGLLTQYLSYKKVFDDDFQESSRISSMLLIPLSIIVSLAVIPEQGVIQLGITLILAALFYGLQAIHSTSEENKINNTVTSYIFALNSIGTLALGYTDSWVKVSYVMLAVNILQATIFFVLSKNRSNTNFNRAIALVILGSSVVSVFTAVQKPLVVFASLIAVFYIAILVWWRTREYVSYTLSLAVLPIAAVEYQLAVAKDYDSPQKVAFSITLAFLAQALLAIVLLKKLNKTELYISKIVILITGILSIFYSFGAQGQFSIYFTLIVVATSLLLGLISKDRDYVMATSIITTIPILRNIAGGVELFYSALPALLYNIYMALKYREEIFRWVGSAVWFTMPILLNSGFSLGWGSEQLTISYLVVVMGFIVARSIARGSVFASDKIPLISYDRNKSLSYVFGYILASLVALGLSVSTNNSQIYTSITLAFILVMIVLLAEFIEKRKEIYVLAPILTQFILVSAFDVSNNNQIVSSVYGISSLFVALLIYWVTSTEEPIYKTADNKSTNVKALVNIAALLSSYIAIATGLAVGQSWGILISFFVTAYLTFNYFKSYSQGAKEIGGLIVMISVLAIASYGGLKEFQAYSHILALTIFIFAYWRNQIEDYDTEKLYTICALAIATVPLVLQALSGDAGGLYGWWLLLENIVFMLIGLTIGNKLVTWWGLYVAIGAVLYQLRGLGWAALSLLAVVIIGIAIYKIAKNNDSSN